MAPNPPRRRPASPRFITAYGRDVDVPESQLVYDAPTRHLTIEDGSRREAAAGEALADVLDLLARTGTSLSGRAIKDALRDSERPRDTIEAALKFGERTSQLSVESGARNASFIPTTISVRECPGVSAGQRK
jgi:hypothetical protein